MARPDPTCLRCHYDLRGLPPTSNCPECGLAVSFSLSPPTTLSAAPPSWARTLAIGAALLALSMIAIPITSPIMEALFPYNSTSTNFPHVYLIRQSGMAGVLLLHALAIWILTVREPRAPRLSHRQLGAWIARVCSLTPAAGVGLSAYLLFANLFFRAPYMFEVVIAFYTPVPALIFLHLRRLSARIGRPRLAEHAGIVGVGLSLCFVAFVAVAFLPLVERARFPLVILPVACFILGYFWGLFLLLRLTVAFARAIAEARATWTHFDAATTPANSANPS